MIRHANRRAFDLAMKTAVLLSGGVDSSVALRLVRDAGAGDITAFYLKVWLEDELSFLGDCPWDEDIGFARAVCESIGVPLEIVPMQREYHQRVVAYTIAELRAGRTPSPDLFCNQRVKFGAFLDAIDAEFRSVVTGHYAIVEARDGVVRLRRGVDPVKDQTYFLSCLDQGQLARCRFPLGGLAKREVRRLAEEFELPNRARPDSQGICFLGKIRFRDFVRHHLGERPGAIRDLATGSVLGEHRGSWFYTIGQRRGLGLAQGPWYVVRKDLDEGIVWVAHADRLDECRREAFRIGTPHWIGTGPSGAPLGVKLRHGERVLACRLEESAAGDADRRATVRLATPDPGIAAGQFAVFYEGDECIGAAPIEA